MPITGPSSYLPTTDAFLSHWASVNTFLSPGALVLEGNRTVAQLTGLRASLAGARTDVEAKLNGLEIARADSALKRGPLLGRIGQGMDNIRGFWGNTAFAATLPNMPSESDSPQKVERALDDVADAWSRINNTPPPPRATSPMTLATEPTQAVPSPPPYTQANFTAEIATLKSAHTAIKAAEVALDGSRAARNPLADTLPRYSPLPGATPEAPNLTGSWNAPAAKAFLDFTPTTSASVVRHELRYTPGPDYSTEDETIVTSINVGQPSHFETLAGLPTPGAVASYRLYAVTGEGNEKGSATVVITRPA